MYILIIVEADKKLLPSCILPLPSYLQLDLWHLASRLDPKENRLFPPFPWSMSISVSSPDFPILNFKAFLQNQKTKLGPWKT